MVEFFKHFVGHFEQVETHPTRRRFCNSGILFYIESTKKIDVFKSLNSVKRQFVPSDNSSQATIRPKRQFVPSDNSSQIPKSDNSSHFEKATIRPNYQKLQFVLNLIANKDLGNKESGKITIRGRCQQLISTFHY